MTTPTPRLAMTRAAGFTLIGLSLLSVLFMSHHPTLGAPGHDTLAHEAVAEAGVNGVVHGALFVITIGFYVCLSVFSSSQQRQTIMLRVGAAGFACATITMCGAAIVSGFVVPATAASLLRGGLEADFETQLRMLGAVNQTLASTSVISYGAAILVWSTTFITRSGLMRPVGALGLAAGAILMIGKLSSMLVLNIQGMTLALLIMIVWFIALSIVMIRRDQ